MLDEFNIIKRKKKKNAFASTALLISIAIAVLVIILIVLLIGRNKTTSGESNSCNGTTNVTCTSRSKEEKFTDNLRTIKDAAVSYFTIERMPEEVGDTVKLTLKEMQQKKLVLDILDSTGKKCSTTNSYVEVTKEENEYVMKLHLSCDDMEDYIVIHLGCYDYCKGTVCEKEVEPEVTEFEYEYKKEVACKMSDWSAWSEWSTKKQTASSTKKVETKTEKDIDVKDATKNPDTYNCDKYPGYNLEGNECVKRTTKVEEKDATKVPGGYVCPDGYKQNGKKCSREVVTEYRYNATKNPATYNCDKYPGYKLEGDKCKKTTTKTDTQKANVTYNCKNHPGYDVVGSKCKKTTTTTDTKPASPVYSTRQVAKTCYRQECTDKPVFTCDASGCGTKPVTSCESVKYTCYQQEKYISSYSCSAYPGYDVVGTECKKTTSTTDTKDATPVYDCKNHPGYDVVGTECKKTTTTTDTKDATKNPDTYNCDKYPGAKLEGNKCIVTSSSTETIDATPSEYSYNCDKYPGYELEGTKCKKTTVITETKDPVKVPGKYTCPKGYTISGTTCTKEIKITYYRYATRTCDGGSVSIKWSTSQNDESLLNDGYKLTGNKKAITKVSK